MLGTGLALPPTMLTDLRLLPHSARTVGLLAGLLLGLPACTIEEKGDTEDSASGTGSTGTDSTDSAGTDSATCASRRIRR